MYRKTLDYARKGVLVASISALDIAIMDLKAILRTFYCRFTRRSFQKKVKPYATGMYFPDLENPSKNYQKKKKLKNTSIWF